MRYLNESILIGLGLTALSYVVAHFLGWATIDKINWLEAFAVFTSYSCTWLCTRQSRINYLVGVVTTAAYSLLFWQFEMHALALFNLYLVGSMAYGWIRWGRDDQTRPVTNVDQEGYTFYCLFGLIILVGYVLINHLIDPNWFQNASTIDIGLAVASGVAQIMLDNKKLENWILWAGINIVSIPYFIHGGLYIVAFQYIFFLVNTFIGYIEWRKTMNGVENAPAIV